MIGWKSKIRTYYKWGGNSHKIIRTAAYTPVKSMAIPVSRYNINLTKESRGLISNCR